MSVAPSDIQLVYPKLNAEDVFRRVGGYHTNVELDSEVNALFQPGMILDSDASDDYYYQYRKAFVKNNSGQTVFGCRVWGFNTKSSNYMKFALERDIHSEIKVDGSDTIKDYTTAPSIYTYEYTEVHSDESMLIGSEGCGILSDGSAQGIWIRLQIPKDGDEIATDTFNFGFEYTEVE